MTMHSLIFFLISVVALSAAATPYVPRSGADIIETIARRADPEQRELAQLRDQLAAAPRNATLAITLATRYIAIGRRESDPRYFGYAQAALAPWWEQPAPPPQLRLLRAALLQNMHHFSEAMADLDAVTRAEPANAQAWLTRATVQTVQGDYAGATASCAQVARLADQLLAYTCLANAAGANGKLAASERLLEMTLARSTTAPAEQQTWALTLLAELAARRGAAAVADGRFQRALKGDPTDSYLLGAYADFLLDQRRAAEVLPLLKDHAKVDGLLLRYALALAAQGGSARELAAASEQLQARYQAAAQRGDNVHRREQARFELYLRGDAGAALKLAVLNWSVQKEVADTRILFEAALAARDAAAAGPAMAWLGRVSQEDVALRALSAKLGKQS
jgi:predicted Zn-dependent protease